MYKLHYSTLEFISQTSNKVLNSLAKARDKGLEYSLEYKTISVEFWLKNSKGGENPHKAVIEYALCWDCPSSYATIKLYGWNDKKKMV